MKKFFTVAAAFLMVCFCASAQRGFYQYASAGITGIDGDVFDNPGICAAYGTRNYNPDAFVSFVYGGELFGTFVPLRHIPKGFALFAVPEIGMTLGPRGIKGFLHAGPMFGYNTVAHAVGMGGKSGVAIDIGEHIGLDVSGYFQKGIRIAACSVIWRF